MAKRLYGRRGCMNAGQYNRVQVSLPLTPTLTLPQPLVRIPTEEPIGQRLYARIREPPEGKRRQGAQDPRLILQTVRHLGAEPIQVRVMARLG